MNCVSTLVAIGGLMLVGAHARAVNPTSQSSLNRRNIIDCMTRKMSASKSISYNEAAKFCKSQMKSQNDKLAVNGASNLSRARQP